MRRGVSLLLLRLRRGAELSGAHRPASKTAGDELGAILATEDYYALLGAKRVYGVNEKALEAAFKDLQRKARARF